MPDRISWQFPPNVTDAPIGPRDQGIEHYTGQRIDSLVRETIQNSLDAQAKPGEMPAKVKFQVTELTVSSFNGEELAKAVNASIAELKPKDEAYRKKFRNATKQLDNATIPTLMITDSNTTGVRDDDADNSWAALTRGSGESTKQGNNASGSYGIGKAAAYTATDLRTVLYATTFVVNGHTESRFIGKTILSGHKDTEGQKVTSEGYLSGPDFSNLRNEDIPEAYRLEEPGLRLWIPGYKVTGNWEEQIIKIAFANFFHAIVKGELEIATEYQVVNKANVGDYATILSARERHLLNTSGIPPVAKGYIERIGKVSLRMTLHDSKDEGAPQDVALVRDAGMMITRERSKMGPAQFRIPGHWQRFTAVLECLSDTGQESRSAIRDCESPKHDELSVDHIPNDEDRIPARKALHELGEWAKEEIRKLAEPPRNTEPVNAREAAELLPIRGQSSGPNHRPDPGNDNVSKPVQRGTSAPGTQITLPPGTPDPDKPTPDPDKPHKPPKPPTPPKPQTVAGRDTLARAKFRAGGRSDTHGLTIQIPPFDKRISNVQIQAVTEHGKDIQMKIGDVWSNGKALKKSKNKIKTILHNGNSPVTLEVIMQEPVAGRRFRLRTADEGKKA